MSQAISAALVNELRNKTGAGMMDCKKALVENNGDLQASIDWLRKKGAASVAKKADRQTSEGAICIATSTEKAVILELNCETDFVAKNEKFQDVINKVTQHALNATNIQSVDDLLASVIEANTTVSEYIINSSAVIGEKLSLSSFKIEQGGLVYSYIHNAYTAKTGKIGVLVSFESNLSKEILAELGRKVAMHIAAADPLPLALNAQDIAPEVVERERQIFTEQAQASGKPAVVIEKMLEGKMRTFYEGVVLNEQNFVLGDKIKIKELVGNFAKEKGGTASIKSFQRFQIGSR